MDESTFSIEISIGENPRRMHAVRMKKDTTSDEERVNNPITS